LAGDIADGSLPPETQLPSEDGLLARFKVSRTSVRKAIQNLVERGLIEVRRASAIVERSQRAAIRSHSHVMQPSSLPVDRRARRAKTDIIDVERCCCAR
jgi:DNA-binding GntR family transcriptional regulator